MVNMLGMISIVVWFALSFAVGTAANTRGYNGVLWLFISLITSPILGLCFLLAKPDDVKRQRDEKILYELRALNSSIKSLRTDIEV